MQTEHKYVFCNNDSLIFRFLSDVILEASKLLAESLKKEMDHNDATHQTLMENMTKNKKAVKKVSIFRCSKEVVNYPLKKGWKHGIKLRKTI